MENLLRERREYLRVEDVDSVIYQRIFPLPQTSLNSGIRENISGGGIKLVTEENFSVGDILYLKIDLRESLNKITIEATGKVVWIRKREEMYEVGISFLDILEQHRRKIINYVFKKQREKKFSNV